MNEFLQQLISMGPGIGAGVAGNGPAFEAFMQGYERARQAAEVRKRAQTRDQLDQQELRLREEQMAQQSARQAAADARSAEDQRRQDQQYLMQLSDLVSRAGAGAQSLPDGEASIDSTFGMLTPEQQAQLAPVRDRAMAGVQRTISARQKNQAADFLKLWEDSEHAQAFIDAGQTADRIVIRLPEHMQKYLGKPEATLAEVQQFASLPVGTPAKKKRNPAAPGSMEEFSDPTTTPERKAQILADRKAYMQSDDQPRVTVNTGQSGAHPPATQRRIDAVVRGFDSQAIVKKTQTMAEAVSFADSLDINTKNPADDQALIYAFAKAMDPESVVREGEYATVQKYAQSWLSSTGFNLARVLDNTEFLTPQARANMKATIRSKFAAARGQYDNVRREYGRKIERITGKTGGVDELTDFGAAFPQEAAAPPPPSTTQTASGPKVGERRKIRGQLAEWDGKGWLPVR